MLDVDSLGTREGELLEEYFFSARVWKHLKPDFSRMFFPKKKTLRDAYMCQFTNIYSLDKIVSWNMEIRSTTLKNIQYTVSVSYNQARRLLRRQELGSWYLSYRGSILSCLFLLLILVGSVPL